MSNIDIQPSNDDIESMQWAAIRTKRNAFIKETDHTQVIDSPFDVDKRTEFATYRQELRDLPQSFENPDDVVWPVKPE